MVRQDCRLAEPFGQMMRHPFGESTRVHENQCRAMREYEFGKPIVDSRPHLVTGDRTQFILRNFDGDIQRTPVTAVDDSDLGLFSSCNEPSDLFYRSYGRRESNPLWLRATGFSTRSSSRAIDNARCAPRLSSTTAWISSRMTVWVRRQHRSAALGRKQDE